MDGGTEAGACSFFSSSEAASVVASDDVETRKPDRERWKSPSGLERWSAFGVGYDLLLPHPACVDDLDLSGSVKVFTSGISRPITHKTTTLRKIMLRYEAMKRLISNENSTRLCMYGWVGPL